MTDLSAEAVALHLARLGSPVGRPLSVVAETASTSDDARLAAAAGAPHGAAFLADAQTRGRGRGGHTWHSPPGENLYMSIIARPRVPAAGVAPAALAVGVAAARVIAPRLSVPVWIKWPNDVLAGPAAPGAPPIRAARKLAGILVEGQLRGGDVAGLIIGIGVNVRAAAFPPDIADRATSLRLAGAADLDRSALAAELIAAVGEALDRYEEDRLASFLPDLAARDALRGAQVVVSGVRGEAAGIDAEGRLLVRGDAGAVVPVATGEVTLA